MVSEVHREERWSTRDLTLRWSEPLTGKKITKVKLESRTLKSELAVDPWVVEIVADVNLRDHFGLQDGDVVEIGVRT
jgi:hypothetical protein